jgi:hypothetical protein
VYDIRNAGQRETRKFAQTSERESWSRFSLAY